jgi:hypothetical protein
MGTLLIGIGLVALLLAFILLTALAAFHAGRLKGVPLVGLANIAEGIHAGGQFTKLTDAAHALRFLLVKPGTDGDHIAIAGAADFPYAVCTDEAAAAEAEVNVQALACSPNTVKVVNDATGAIAVGDNIVPAANGKVKKMAAGAGNYFWVGVAMQTAAADGDIFEIIPIGAGKTQ